MTGTAAIVLRLQAVLDRAGLSPRATRRCEGLIDRLRTPVRVAVFGLPQSGKACLVNALAETPVLQSGAQTAPTLIRRGGKAVLTITCADGCTTSAPATLPIAPPPDAVFAELALPLDPLNQMSLLNVVTDPSPEDMIAGLAWAASRCDIAIWCTRHWTRLEQDSWSKGPDGLKNHALLAAIRDVNAPEISPSGGGLEQTFCALTLDDSGAALTSASAKMLRQRLTRMIAEARTADLDAATFLLEQYAPQLPEAPKPRVAAPEVADLRLVQARPVPDKAKACAPAPQAHVVLSRLFLDLRQTARGLSATAPQEEPAALLTRLQEMFDDLLDRAEAEPTFADTWPGLLATLREAGDLVLLLAIEGHAAQANKAAILLAQVRQDVEQALAA